MSHDLPDVLARLFNGSLLETPIPGSITYPIARNIQRMMGDTFNIDIINTETHILVLAELGNV